MTGVRSVVLTILLAVWAVELVLPLNSHHGFDAGTRRAYYLIELNASPTATESHSADSASWLGRAAAPKVRLLVNTQPASSLPLVYGFGMLWLQAFYYDLLFPVQHAISLPKFLYTEAHAPPIEIPPRRVTRVL